MNCHHKPSRFECFAEHPVTARAKTHTVSRITADLSALSRLLDHGLELQADATEDWFAGLAPDQRHLVPALRELLAEHLSGARAEFMAVLPTLPEASCATVAHAGDMAGPYRLLREIGRGGMSAVWLAERADDGLARPVAIKLPCLAQGADLAGRMARERDICALMDHPNITRLCDAGFDAQLRPYLVLDYIDGQPLDAWCKTHRPDLPARLRLFLQLAHAVTYAHGQGVVHRDLKPSNVLVTDDGQAHLLDFGIATLVDGCCNGQPTVEIVRSLTPGYASPEQVQGATTTYASDVYSLGVLLFELLTGQLPHTRKRSVFAAPEDVDLNVAPPVASSLVQEPATAEQLRGPLDAILSKALQMRPDKRYATAAALAGEIERFLDGCVATGTAKSAARVWPPVNLDGILVTTEESKITNATHAVGMPAAA